MMRSCLCQLRSNKSAQCLAATGCAFPRHLPFFALMTLGECRSWLARMHALLDNSTTRPDAPFASVQLFELPAVSASTSAMLEMRWYRI
mmetsp:Transcript_7087/g.9153  ORF Transcript_7087/g.9153 Transcript_7087/m.9153 type:complete len:89 (-) Transcript_7087:18-284(-)